MFVVKPGEDGAILVSSWSPVVEMDPAVLLSPRLSSCPLLPLLHPPSPLQLPHLDKVKHLNQTSRWMENPPGLEPDSCSGCKNLWFHT